MLLLFFVYDVADDDGGGDTFATLLEDGKIGAELNGEMKLSEFSS